jgi:hypothetical protein
MPIISLLNPATTSSIFHQFYPLVLKKTTPTCGRGGGPPADKKVRVCILLTLKNEGGEATSKYTCRMQVSTFSHEARGKKGKTQKKGKGKNWNGD